MSRSIPTLVAYLLLVAIALVLWMGLWSPLSQWRKEAIFKKVTAKQELSALQVAQKRLENERAALETSTDDGLLWSAEQIGEAYAKVQAQVSEAAAQNGVSIRAATPLPTQTSGDIQNVVIRIEFEADLAQLIGFLRAVEYSSPVLPVQSANLRRIVRLDPGSEMPVLFSQIDVSAPFLIKDGS